VNDFNVYQRLLLIFVVVSVIELIFVQQCIIRFAQLVTLKVCGGQFGTSGRVIGY